MIAKKTICIKCQNALVLSYHFEQTSFLKFKGIGGLVKRTKSVVIICEETERCFQMLLASTNGNLPNEKEIQNAISSAVLRSVDYSKIFNEQTSHMFDSAITELISKNYAKICLYHLGKEKTAKITGKKLRKQLTKLILFKNQ